MERELSRAEVEAQIKERQRRITERLNVLEHEARFLGQSAMDQVSHIKEKARENLPVVGGAVVGGGILLKLLFGRRGKTDPDLAFVPRRYVTEEFAAALARSIQQRLNEGDELSIAIRKVLQARSPILLRRSPEKQTSRSILGWVAGAGLIAAGVLAADYAARQFTGKHLNEWIQDLLAGDRAGDYSVDRQHTVVHGTSGARMPDPDRQPAVSGVYGQPAEKPASSSSTEPSPDTPEPPEEKTAGTAPATGMTSGPSEANPEPPVEPEPPTRGPRSEEPPAA